MIYRFIGVSDLAAIRFSLPAQLIEPIPNLGTLGPTVWGWRNADVGVEYWNYLDRPETFIRLVRTVTRHKDRQILTSPSIGDSEDPVGRMLGTLRFWFTKDLVRKPVDSGGVVAHMRSEIRQRKAS